MQGEVIYKGATRPAMKLGVPLVPLVALSGAGMLAALWGGTLWSGWVVPAVLLAVAPALLWMRWVTRRDDQRLRQMALALRLRLRDRNHRLWHARSYSPTVYRGTRDAWRR